VNPDRWKKVDALFHAALEQPRAGRLEWLAVECDDSELFADVSALLASDEAAEGGFVEAKVAGAIIDFHEKEVATNRMRRVGPYRLVREQGRGGMGTVYLAERADDQYTAKVAIKLIRPGMDTDFFLSRFRRERQTLARLEHPNIARLLDSGTTDDGLPYIVMELIDGRPINHYCVERQLTVDQIIQLFLPICAAVSHAHQNFVVHRDIKPGNILVDSTGTPKLLDFGICKLLFAPSPDVGTITNAQMMSPDYASPEQVQALPITVASDIYSLAAVLYELLSGRKPHRIAKYTPQAVERAICEEDVLPPSAAVGNVPLAKRLSGDLDTILLRALDKVPERRYDSVGHFADDLQRHLMDLPVSARPDTLGYRASKFIRRNRGALAAGTAVGLAICGGAIAAAYEAVRARRHAADARHLANAMIFDVHDLVRNLPGSLEARERIIRLGITHFDRLAANVSTDAQLRREISAAYERMGEIQGNVLGSYRGDTDAALSSFNKALALLEPLPASREVELDRILLFQRIGEVQAYVRSEKEAMGSYDAALSRAKKLHASYPEDNLVRTRLADVHMSICRTQRSAGDRQSALVHILDAMMLYEEVLKENRDDEKLRASIASGESVLGTILANLNHLEAACKHFRRAVSAYDELLARDPSNIHSQRQQMLAYSHLGEVLGYPSYPNLGDREGARAAFQSMLTIAKRLRQSDPADQAGIIDVGMSLMRVAAIAEKNAEKLSLYREAEALLDQVARLQPTNSANMVNVAAIREEIGNTLLAMGDREAAVHSFKHALATAESGRSLESLSGQRIAITSARSIAEQLAMRGNREGALVYAQKALDVVANSDAANNSPVPVRSLAPRAFHARGLAHAILNEQDEARIWLGRSLAIWRSLEGLPDFTSAHAQEKELVEQAIRALQKARQKST